VFVVWGFGSLVGGAACGVLPRAASSAVLVLALLTVPLGLVGPW
jgi:cell division GTPase FtsZ